MADKAATKPDRVCNTCARNLSKSGPRPTSTRGACNDCQYPWRTCSMCGEYQRWDEPEHEGIERIVRANENYGGVLPGKSVMVEERHLGDAHVQRATMSMEEANAIDKARREAITKTKEPPRLIQGLARSMEAERQRSEKELDAGRRRAQRDAEQASTRARELG